MSLQDKYLPRYSFKEVHYCDIRANPACVIEASANYQPEHDPFFRRMIFLREIPMRVSNYFHKKQSDKPAAFGLHNFTMLEKNATNELGYGLIGRFWRLNFGLVEISDGEQFIEYNTKGVAKLTLFFTATLQSNGTTRLTTETRVFCPDFYSKFKFTPYWYLIRPVSGMIRSRILKAIKKASELHPHNSNVA
ncbi:hypothetical protein ACLBWZ_06120 [Brucellaceae bacterium C25G]